MRKRSSPNQKKKDIEGVLASLRQLRLHSNDKEAARRALLLKIEEMPAVPVREEADVRLPEHMDTLTASFLAECQALSLNAAEQMDVKMSLLSYMQAKPRAANVPVISYLSVLGTISMEAADKQLVRDELVAAMHASSPAPVAQEVRHEDSIVMVFSSLLCGRATPAFA